MREVWLFGMGIVNPKAFDNIYWHNAKQKT